MGWRTLLGISDLRGLGGLSLTDRGGPDSWSRGTERNGVTLRVGTLDRLIPVWCATLFAYILEKLAREQESTLGSQSGLFGNHTPWHISGKLNTITAMAAQLFYFIFISWSFIPSNPNSYEFGNHPWPKRISLWQLQSLTTQLSSVLWGASLLNLGNVSIFTRGPMRLGLWACVCVRVCF